MENFESLYKRQPPRLYKASLFGAIVVSEVTKFFLASANVEVSSPAINHVAACG